MTNTADLRIFLLKNRRIFLIIAGLIIFTLLFWLFVSRQAFLPQKFLAAREEAAGVSQKIVELTDSVNGQIKAINLSDLNGDPDQAAILIRRARETNNEAYSQAFVLSRTLQKLAESLPEIKSSSNRSSAYEAVAVELALVSEFINYTQSLNNFFDSLVQTIGNDNFANRRQVEERLETVNQKAKTINNLNSEFLAKMGRFAGGF